MNNIKIKFLKSLIIISYIFLYMVSIYTIIYDIQSNENFFKIVGAISFVFLCLIIIIPILLYHLGYNGLLKFHLLFILLASVEGIYILHVIIFYNTYLGSGGLVLLFTFYALVEILFNDFRFEFVLFPPFIIPLLISLYYHRIYNKIIKNNSSIHSKFSIHIHKKVNIYFIPTYFIIGVMHIGLLYYKMINF